MLKGKKNKFGIQREQLFLLLTTFIDRFNKNFVLSSIFHSLQSNLIDSNERIKWNESGQKHIHRTFRHQKSQITETI